MPTTLKTKKLCFNVLKSDLDALHKILKQDGTSLSDWGRNILADYVAKRNKSVAAKAGKAIKSVKKTIKKIEEAPVKPFRNIVRKVKSKVS